MPRGGGGGRSHRQDRMGVLHAGTASVAAARAGPRARSGRAASGARRALRPGCRDRRAVRPRHARGRLPRRRRPRHRPAGVDVGAARRRVARPGARGARLHSASAEAGPAQVARHAGPRRRGAALPGLPRGRGRRHRLPAAAGPRRRSLAVPRGARRRVRRFGPGTLGVVNDRSSQDDRPAVARSFPFGRWRRAALPGVFLLAALLVAWTAWQRFIVPRPAPDLAFQSIDGRRIELADLRGQVVMVEFWATSCVICVREMPEIVALARELEPRGLATIAVAMPYDRPDHVVAYAKRNDLPFVVALDPLGKA